MAVQVRVRRLSRDRMAALGVLIALPFVRLGLLLGGHHAAQRGETLRYDLVLDSGSHDRRGSIGGGISVE